MKWLGYVLLCAVLAWVSSADAQPGEPDDPAMMDMTEPGTRHYEVLSELPLDPACYKPQAAALIRDGIVERYGKEEWGSIVLTQELHNHVGIMTVVGAKMAVRAREVLRCPMRHVQVLAETGDEEPFSCAVDGLQIGLASTYAQGLIEAPPSDSPRLAASFTWQGKTLRLALKAEYAKRIRQYIHSAIQAHGNLTVAYFEEIERNCYEVWADFDRREVFEETWTEAEVTAGDN